MPTYKRAGKEIEQMVQAILKQFETHAPIIEAKGRNRR